MVLRPSRPQTQAVAELSATVGACAREGVRGQAVALAKGGKPMIDERRCSNGTATQRRGDKVKLHAALMSGRRAGAWEKIVASVLVMAVHVHGDYDIPRCCSGHGEAL